jgi:membrane-bound transcription factor site-1 protease
LDTG